MAGGFPDVTGANLLATGRDFARGSGGKLGSNDGSPLVQNGRVCAAGSRQWGCQGRCAVGRSGYRGGCRTGARAGSFRSTPLHDKDIKS